jgi:hypothetical protein
MTHITFGRKIVIRTKWDDEDAGIHFVNNFCDGNTRTASRE